MDFIATKPPPLILYGSETGTAEDVAYALGARLSLQPQVSDIELFDVTQLPGESACGRCVIFVVSTSGDGEVPTSMKQFWQFLLRRSLASTSLNGLHVAVFGLGDSSYEKYNAAARKLSKRLKQLGAAEIVPLGLGDDQAQYGYLTALNAWSEKLARALSVAPSLEKCDKTTPEIYELRLPATPHSWPSKRAQFSSFTPPSQCKLAPGALPLIARVSLNTRMTASQWGQDVRHIALDLTSSVVVDECVSWPLFVAGDVATVHPCNPTELVARAIKLAFPPVLGSALPTLAENTPIEIIYHGTAKRKNRLSTNLQCTLHDLFLRYLDIGGVPRRTFFEGLSAHASNEEERDKLLELSSARGTDLFFEYCIRERRNYIEVLEEFRSARPSLSQLLELIPPLQGRHYSIASSGHVNPAELQLCAAVVEHKTPYGRKRLGVCSSYLASLSVGDEVVLWVRAGSFKAPEPSRPVVLIGPGTGVAPMRAVLQERRASVSAQSLLFFGCRKRNSDFLFGQEWSALEKEENSQQAQGRLLGPAEEDLDAFSNNLMAVTTAFSQDGPPNAAKPYVMAKIRQHGALVWSLLTSGACILVSGSAKRMPSDVRKALCQVIQTHGSMGEAESERYLLKMEAAKTYVVEAWS